MTNRQFIFLTHLQLKMLKNAKMDAVSQLFVDFLPVLSCFNTANLNLYHYAGNNPVKYVDPDGNSLTGSLIISALLTGVSVYIAKNMPSKEEHYSRNEAQKEYEKSCPTRQDAINNGFNQLGADKGIKKAEDMDKYHEMGTGNPHPAGNDKLVKRDISGDGKGSFELVYDSKGNLVSDFVNQGTYNISDASNSYVGHFIKDMLPYYLWGNSSEDPTTMGERIMGSYEYDVNATKDEAAQQREAAVQPTYDALRKAHIW